MSKNRDVLDDFDIVSGFYQSNTYGGYYPMSEEVSEALDNVKKALERNEAKEPDQMHPRGKWYCQNCYEQHVDNNQNYCPYCGQRLDWEAE